MENSFNPTRFKAIFGLFLLILAGLVFLNSDFFTVHKVIIQGNQAVATEDIAVAAGLNLHINMFQINESKINNAIMASNTYIASVTLRKHYPDEMIIQVKERKPLCLYLYRGEWVVVGDDGVVIGEKPEGELDNLPTVSGITHHKIKIGAALDTTMFQDAFFILKVSDQHLRTLLRLIDLQNYRLTLVLPNSHQSVLVELGNSDKLDKKMNTLIAILANTNLQKIAQIDLRIAEIPTISST